MKIHNSQCIKLYYIYKLIVFCGINSINNVYWEKEHIIIFILFIIICMCVSHVSSVEMVQITVIYIFNIKFKLIFLNKIILSRT